MTPVFPAVLLFLAPWSAHAISNPKDCALIDAERERLACYDGIFRTGTPARSREASAPERTTVSPLLARRAEEAAQEHRYFSIIPHRPNYFIPASYNPSADYSQYGQFEDLFKDTEIKFQLSLKTPVVPRMWRNSSLWIAYTQQSYWQLYADEDASEPFRETNHEPELIWQLPLNFQVLGFDARVASFSLNHQSNGQIEPLSRSWNRLTGALALERGRFVAYAQSWVRTDNSGEDENPNIERFMGQMLLGGAYKGNRHTFAVGLKNNLRADNRSGVEFNWTFPLTQQLKAYVQLYSGYGENLIDMENYNNRIGVGLALTDWL